MKTKGKTLNAMQLEQALAEKSAGFYRAPQVEVIDIELIHNILASPNTPTDLPDMPGDYY